MSSQNIETSKKAYAAFAEGDLDTVLSTFDDNVEFVVPVTARSAERIAANPRSRIFSRS